MSYLSIEFSLLFIVFFSIYWILASHIILQNGWIVVFSYALVSTYSWIFAAILFGYTIFIFLLSSLIYHSKRYAKVWLICGLCLAVINLAIFKYFDFFRYELQILFNSFDVPILLPIITILVPIGISFYTFHSISYLVSVYKRELACGSFLDCALFLSFFPSIIAGPINRANDFFPQISVVKKRSILEPHRACVLIILSIIKVYCVGGLIDEHWVKPIFSNPLGFGSLDLLFGLYAYGMLIYFNFSGYTDLVTGIALLLGFRLPVNFDTPYLAKNLRDFWVRWHISLSSWIRDYVYIPLGGNRHGFILAQVNVMIAMLLSGLWHGVGVNFIIWAACHAFGITFLNIISSYVGKNLVSQYSHFLAKFITLNYVCFAWIFFYYSEWDDAIDYIHGITRNILVDNDYVLECIAILVLYCFYPWLKAIPAVVIDTVKKISYLYLPFIFIIILWVVIYLAPSGVPNFIYASF